YTSIFTFPFIYILLSCYNEFGTFTISIFYLIDYTPSSLLVSLIIFFTFAVKLPIYGLHY
ncbi:MAG: hypothetical protein KDH96_13595, partial [Candidatus Riesia sp.]|nr:hypothetical protein [Candidatus Riesia sp.]